MSDQAPKPEPFCCPYSHCKAHQEGKPVCHPWIMSPFEGSICPDCGHWSECHAMYWQKVEAEREPKL